MNSANRAGGPAALRIGFIEKAVECKAKKKDLGAVDGGHPKSLGISVGKLLCSRLSSPECI
jgi:hypothetical protein